MVKVINIKPEYEPLLSFLYPDYSITADLTTTKFIAHRDIKSKAEREALSVYYDDCIIISSQIFDEFWDMNKLSELVIEFAHKTFKSRKKKFQYDSTTFVSDALNFIFDLSLEEQEKSIFELFDTFGSNRFSIKYMELTKQYPYQVLNSSLNTFITKIMNDTTNIYYLKKASLFKNSIQRNLNKALSNQLLIADDSYGFKSIKFYQDLCSN